MGQLAYHAVRPLLMTGVYHGMCEILVSSKSSVSHICEPRFFFRSASCVDANCGNTSIVIGFLPCVTGFRRPSKTCRAPCDTSFFLIFVSVLVLCSFIEELPTAFLTKYTFRIPNHADSLRVYLCVSTTTAHHLHSSVLRMVSNIAVFGGNGLTGSEVVYQALNRDCKVTAFCRDPSKLKVSTDVVKTS